MPPSTSMRLAGDVAAGVGGEEQQRAVEVAGRAGAAERDAFAQVFDPAWVFVQRAVLLRS